MFITLLLIFVALLLFKNRKPKDFPPGPPWIPVLGSFIKLGDFQFNLGKMVEKYGPVIGMRFGWRYAIVVSGKKEVEEVLRRDEFQGRPDLTKTGKGVMFSDGEFWTNQRRFTLRHLRDFGFGKNSIEHVILGEVEEFFRTKLADRDTVQVSGLFNTSAVNVLWAMMGGKRYSHDDPELHHLLDCIQRRFRNGTVAGTFIMRFPQLAKLFPFLKIVREEIASDQLIQNFFENAFRMHRLTMEDAPRDLIDVYLNELDKGKDLHPSFSELTLRNICTEFFSAGAESVGNSLGFNVLYSVLFPNWQEELHEEVLSVIGRDRKPTLDDKKRLPKLEAFMTEVSRCNTIASLTVPHRCIRDTTLNGYKIPEDCMVLINLNAVLHDREYWKDPENFRPERFLDSQGAFIKDKEGLPVFGAGKRVCPGESLARNTLFLFFASLIQQYQFSIPSGHPKPSTVCLAGFTQAPRPFEVTFKKRF